MPPQQQPEIDPATLEKFHSGTQEQREGALARMTPELKQRFLPAYQEYKAMHAPDSAYQRPMPPTPQPKSPAFDAAAGFATRNAPAIAGAVGGVLGSPGGIPGATLGAELGGAVGGAIKGKAEGTGAVKEASKGAVTQGALELGGGLAMKGISRVADLLGVKDSMMRFALKRGQDFERNLDPAAMMNKYSLQAGTTKRLFQLTEQKVGQLTDKADRLVANTPQAAQIRPYAIIKSVIDKYRQKALDTASAEEYSAIDKMLKGIEDRYVQTPTSKQVASAVLSGQKVPRPTQTLLSAAQANELKRDFGETVTWGQDPPVDKMQAAFKAESAVRREIYRNLDNSIEQALGGNGREWSAINDNISNLMEAKKALNEAGKRTAGESGKLIPSLLDAMRKPGPASIAAHAPSSTPAQLAIPSAIRLGATAGNELLGQGQNQNPIPTTP